METKNPNRNNFLIILLFIPILLNDDTQGIKFTLTYGRIYISYDFISGIDILNVLPVPRKLSTDSWPT
tara:strand:- start:65 stop:268 length:204 start_codon:yes stop_codon:yes gene_type:complete